MTETQGMKETGEDVIKAALIALVSGLITWGLEEWKRRREEK